MILLKFDKNVLYYINITINLLIFYNDYFELLFPLLNIFIILL